LQFWNNAVIRVFASVDDNTKTASFYSFLNDLLSLNCRIG